MIKIGQKYIAKFHEKPINPAKGLRTEAEWGSGSLYFIITAKCTHHPLKKDEYWMSYFPELDMSYPLSLNEIKNSTLIVTNYSKLWRDLCINTK